MNMIVRFDNEGRMTSDLFQNCQWCSKASYDVICRECWNWLIGRMCY